MEDRIEEILNGDGDWVAELSELVTEYQAKAWDKGFDKGSRAYSGIKRIYVPAGPTKGSRNPYRWQKSDNPDKAAIWAKRQWERLN